MPENKSAQKKCDRMWIVVGDIHEDTGNFEKIPELSGADGIIISGDLTNGGSVRDAQAVLDKILKTNLPVFAQIGNMDTAEIDTWLSERGCNIHGRTIELANDIAIFGIGGSTITPMHTCSEFTEDEYRHWLAHEWKTARDFKHKVLISHNPPKDTPCDAINDQLHVGSEAVREFIEEKQPDICICGHIHEGRAVTKIGATTVINPGTLADGGYVVLCQTGDRLEASLRQTGKMEA